MPENKAEFESVLFIYGDDGQIKGFVRNDIKNRAVKMYGCSELGLDEIKLMINDLDGK